MKEIQASNLSILRDIAQLLEAGEVERGKKLLNMHIRAIETDKEIDKSS